MRDADVPAFWSRLGLDGLIDIHTHFMPDRVMDAVWRYFETDAGDYGKPWPIQYKLPVQRRVDILGELGVRTFTA
ncbi:MAG: amidohydrolase, partial [Jatrophihabitans sp.]